MEDLRSMLKNLAGNMADQTPASLRALADSLTRTAATKKKKDKEETTVVSDTASSAEQPDTVAPAEEATQKPVDTKKPITKEKVLDESLWEDRTREETAAEDRKSEQVDRDLRKTIYSDSSALVPAIKGIIKVLADMHKGGRTSPTEKERSVLADQYKHLHEAFPTASSTMPDRFPVPMTQIWRLLQEPRAYLQSKKTGLLGPATAALEKELKDIETVRFNELRKSIGNGNFSSWFDEAKTNMDRVRKIVTLHISKIRDGADVDNEMRTAFGDIEGSVALEDKAAFDKTKDKVLSGGLDEADVKALLFDIGEWFKRVSLGSPVDNTRRALSSLNEVAAKAVKDLEKFKKAKPVAAPATSTAAPQEEVEEIEKPKRPALPAATGAEMFLNAFQLSYVDYLEAIENLRLLSENPEHVNAKAWDSYVKNYTENTLPHNVRELESHGAGKQIPQAAEAAKLLEFLPVNFSQWEDSEEEITDKVVGLLDSVVKAYGLKEDSPEVSEVRKTLESPENTVYVRDAATSIPMDKEYDLFNRSCREILGIAESVLTKEDAGHHKKENEDNELARDSYNTGLKELVLKANSRTSPITRYVAFAGEKNLIYNQQIKRGLAAMHRDGARHGSNRVSYTYFLEGLMMVLSGLSHIGDSEFSTNAVDKSLVDDLSADLSAVTKVYEDFSKTTSSVITENAKATGKVTPEETAHLRKHNFLDNAKRGHLRDLDVAKEAAEQMLADGTSADGRTLSKEELVQARQSVENYSRERDKAISGGTDYGSILNSAMDSYESSSDGDKETIEALRNGGIRSALSGLDPAGLKKIVDSMKSQGATTEDAVAQWTTGSHADIAASMKDLLSHNSNLSAQDSDRAAKALSHVVKRNPAAVSDYLEGATQDGAVAGSNIDELENEISHIVSSLESKSKNHQAISGADTMGVGGLGISPEAPVTTHGDRDSKRITKLFSDPVKYGTDLLRALKEQGGGKVRASDARKMFTELLEEAKSYMTDTTKVGDTGMTRTQHAAAGDMENVRKELVQMHKRMAALDAYKESLLSGYEYAGAQLLKLKERLDSPDERLKGRIAVPGGKYTPEDSAKGLTRADVAKAKAGESTPAETRSALDAAVPQKRRRQMISAISDLMGKSRWDQMFTDVRRGGGRPMATHQENVEALERHLSLEPGEHGTGGSEGAPATVVVPGYRDMTDEDLVNLVATRALQHGDIQKAPLTTGTPAEKAPSKVVEKFLRSGYTQEMQDEEERADQERTTRSQRVSKKTKDIFGDMLKSDQLRTAADASVVEPEAGAEQHAPGGSVTARIRQLMEDPGFMQRVKDEVSDSKSQEGATAGDFQRAARQVLDNVALSDKSNLDNFIKAIEYLTAERRSDPEDPTSPLLKKNRSTIPAAWRPTEEELSVATAGRRGGDAKFKTNVDALVQDRSKASQEKLAALAPLLQAGNERDFTASELEEMSKLGVPQRAVTYLKDRKFSVDDDKIRGAVESLAHSETQLNKLKEEGAPERKVKKTLPHTYSRFMHHSWDEPVEASYDNPDQLRTILRMLRNEHAQYDDPSHPINRSQENMHGARLDEVYHGTKKAELQDKIDSFPKKKEEEVKKTMKGYIKALYGKAPSLKSSTGADVKSSDLLSLVDTDFASALNTISTLENGPQFVATVHKTMSENAGGLKKLEKKLHYANKSYDRARRDHEKNSQTLMEELPERDKLRGEIEAIEDHLKALTNDDVGHMLWKGGPTVRASEIEATFRKFITDSSDDENHITREIEKLQSLIENKEKEYRRLRETSRGNVGERQIAILARNFMRSIFETVIQQANFSAGQYYSSHDLDVLDMQDIKKVVREELGLFNDTKLISMMYYLKQMRTKLTEFVKHYPDGVYWSDTDPTGRKIINFREKWGPGMIGDRKVSELLKSIKEQEIAVWSKLNTLGRLQDVLEVEDIVEENGSILGGLIKKSDMNKLIDVRNQSEQIKKSAEKDADNFVTHGIKVDEKDWMSLNDFQTGIIAGLKSFGVKPSTVTTKQESAAAKGKK